MRTTGANLHIKLVHLSMSAFRHNLNDMMGLNDGLLKKTGDPSASGAMNTSAGLKPQLLQYNAVFFNYLGPQQESHSVL